MTFEIMLVVYPPIMLVFRIWLIEKKACIHLYVFFIFEYRKDFIDLYFANMKIDLHYFLNHKDLLNSLFIALYAWIFH